MKLDDGGSAGVVRVPDFCMTRVFDENLLVPVISKGVVPPLSKYDVSVTLEQKKTFTDTDQIEALDYGERLLCFQRERRVPYSALFHCCQREKIIRWLEIREENGRFCTRITRAQSLAPGEVGQRELLTILMKSSAPFTLIPFRVMGRLAAQALLRFLREDGTVFQLWPCQLSVPRLSGIRILHFCHSKTWRRCSMSWVMYFSTVEVILNLELC